MAAIFPSCHFCSCAALLSLGLLAGCATTPDKPPRSRDARGGFSVLVEGTDHPAAPRVVADIGTFARARGFVRQAALPGPPVDPVTHESLPAAPERYLRESIELDVSYQPATHRVTAYLHSPVGKRDRKAIDGFYRDFDQEYGTRYGSEDPISESGYSDGSSGVNVIERPEGASVPGPGGGSSVIGNGSDVGNRGRQGN